MECFHPERLRWVDGKSNSADQLSRGIRGDEKERWQHFVQGPGWLSLTEDFWPQGPTSAELEEQRIVTVGTLELKAVVGENKILGEVNVLAVLRCPPLT